MQLYDDALDAIYAAGRAAGIYGDRFAICKAGSRLGVCKLKEARKRGKEILEVVGAKPKQAAGVARSVGHSACMGGGNKGAPVDKAGGHAAHTGIPTGLSAVLFNRA